MAMSNQEQLGGYDLPVMISRCTDIMRIMFPAPMWMLLACSQMSRLQVSVSREISCHATSAHVSICPFQRNVP